MTAIDESKEPTTWQEVQIENFDVGEDPDMRVGGFVFLAVHPRQNDPLAIYEEITDPLGILKIKPVGVRDDPTSKEFSPTEYLSQIHRHTSWDQIGKGYVRLQQKSASRSPESDKKLLVKQNFPAFCACEDAIREFHAEFQDFGTSPLFSVLNQFEDLVEHSATVFIPLLDRIKETDRKRTLLKQLLQKLNFTILDRGAPTTTTTSTKTSCSDQAFVPVERRPSMLAELRPSLPAERRPSLPVERRPSVTCLTPTQRSSINSQRRPSISRINASLKDICSLVSQLRQLNHTEGVNAHAQSPSLSQTEIPKIVIEGEVNTGLPTIQEEALLPEM